MTILSYVCYSVMLNLGKADIFIQFVGLKFTRVSFIITAVAV